MEEPRQLEEEASVLKEDAVREVVKEWKGMPDLVDFSAKGYMCKVGKKETIDRAEVNANAEVLGPPVKHLGLLPGKGWHCWNGFRYSTIRGRPHSSLRAFPSSLPAPGQEASPQPQPQTSDDCCIAIASGKRCASPGVAIRSEAHILKKLVGLFARVAKRGHRPREAGIRELMVVSGIDVPDRSLRSSSKRLSS